MAKERNIVVCIILTIVTCGIYSYVWMAQLNDEVREENNDAAAITGGMVVLLSIITCGIYMIYWFYKMGERTKAVGDNAGITIEDRSVIYLILSILGFAIINLCIIQSDLNNVAKSRMLMK